MNIKTLNVFYGGDFLPYKDKERQVHYPNVGSDFQGAENITNIRFYIDEISSNNTTFAVAIELPNGKIGSKVLSPAQYDSEIGEYYVTLDIDRFITQKVGNVSISLRGYQGDIELEYDDDTQLYVLVSGTPITAVTGSIKLRVNQEPQALQGDLDEEVTLQELLGLLATKLNVGDGIVILGDISTANLSDYEVGQIFYDRDTHTYYEKTDTSPYYTKALSGVGVLGAPNIVCKNDDETRTISQLNMIYSDMRIFSSSYLGKDFLCCTKSQGSNLYTFVAFDIENQTFYKKASVSGDTLPSSVLVPANKIEIASKAFLTSNYVPYSGANSDINLGGHFINNAKTENLYLNHKENEDNISSVKFVLGNAIDLTEVGEIGEGEYPYLLKPNSTILYGGDIYKHITDTQTDLVYAYLNGSVTTQTDGTSLHLGAIIKISKTEVGGVHQYNRESVDIDLYSKDQAKAKFGTSLALDLNNTNYKLVAKLYNANGGLINTSNAIDFPLESIVSSATYYDTYTYEGTTYTKVIVITLSTTSVPTIVPVGDLISGLEKEACVEIDEPSGTFTQEQMNILALDNAKIKLGGAYYHKWHSSEFIWTICTTDNILGTIYNSVLSGIISYDQQTGAYSQEIKQIMFYNTDQIDTKVGDLQDGIDANAHDIDTLEGDITDIQGDIDDIDERLDNHDTEIAKLKKDVDYALKYPLLYGQPTTDTEEEVGLTTSQLPATTLPKGLINYVGGMSQKVNQFVRNGNFDDTSNWVGISDVSNNEGHLVTNSQYTFVSQTISTVQGHKYLFKTDIKGSGTGTNDIGIMVDTNGSPIYAQSTISAQNVWETKIAIFTCSSNNIRVIPMRVGENSGGTSCNVYARKTMLADLTDIYGAGNEPTSTDDPRIQWLIHYLTDNPQYDEGSIVNAPVEKLSSKGFNVWDEEWEVGRLDFNGDIYTDTDRRTTGFIPVMPNKTYYQCCPSNAGNGWYAFYDKNKQPILVSDVGIPSNSSFTTPSGCAYLRVTFGYAYGTTYNHDICINLSGTMNGTYLPYQAPSNYPIPAEVKALDGYGLGIDDTLYNYIDFERKKFVKKVGSYTFSGNEQWIVSSNGNYAYITFGFSGYKTPASDTDMPNIVSPFATTSVYNAIYYANVTNAIGSSRWGELVVSIDIYNNISSIVGKTIYFELETPTETDISEYLDRDFPNENLIDTYQGGEVEFENENDIGVPYSLTYQYKVE